MTAIISDLVRAACVVATMAVAASLVVEVRFNLAAIEVASRQQQPAMYARTPDPPVGRLRAVGRAAIEFADAALGVAR